jgi:hypothetical protein
VIEGLKEGETLPGEASYLPVSDPFNAEVLRKIRYSVQTNPLIEGRELLPRLTV